MSKLTASIQSVSELEYENHRLALLGNLPSSDGWPNSLKPEAICQKASGKLYWVIRYGECVWLGLHWNQRNERPQL